MARWTKEGSQEVSSQITVEELLGMEQAGTTEQSNLVQQDYDLPPTPQHYISARPTHEEIVLVRRVENIYGYSWVIDARLLICTKRLRILASAHAQRRNGQDLHYAPSLLSQTFRFSYLALP